MREIRMLGLMSGEGKQPAACRSQYDGKPLYEAIVQKCYDMNIAGATVFRGLEGFGESAEIHKHHLVGRDQPIVVVIADLADRIGDLIPVVEQMMDTGMIAVS